MKYAITTLGCKVNQYETQAVERLLRERGHEPSAPAEADVLIINTCAVTGESARKSRQAARRLRGENPKACLVMCGCFSQLNPDECNKLGAGIIRGSGDRTGLVDDIERAATQSNTIIKVDDHGTRKKFEILPAGAAESRVRAMLKIEDGCDNFCSYCVIPLARGRVCSLPVRKAEEMAAHIQEQGYKELIITGIEISSYGKDLEGTPNLAGLVSAVSAAAPGLRLRLGSLEPSCVTDEFCAVLADAGSVCPHFHLSLQSGCDETLRRMGRKYDTEGFYSVTRRLREFFPGCALTADLIVGFPGETEQEHNETLDFIKKCSFSSMHIFPYSARPGTSAAAMDGMLSRAEKTERAREAQMVADKMEHAYLRGQIGLKLSVLFEAEENEVCYGHSDNYALVSATGEGLRGAVKKVEILEVSGKRLVGKLA